MKFELLCFGEKEGPFTMAPHAYICAKPLSPYPENDPRGGSHLLTNELCSAAECCEEIDNLIHDLELLKKQASKRLPPT